MLKERRANTEDAMHAQASVSVHPNVVSNGIQEVAIKQQLYFVCKMFKA